MDDEWEVKKCTLMNGYAVLDVRSGRRRVKVTHDFKTKRWFTSEVGKEGLESRRLTYIELSVIKQRCIHAIAVERLTGGNNG